MKREYNSPDLEQLDINVERGFEGSWYEESGKGDFTYDTETDDRWE